MSNYNLKQSKTIKLEKEKEKESKKEGKRERKKDMIFKEATSRRLKRICKITANLDVEMKALNYTLLSIYSLN